MKKHEPIKVIIFLTSCLLFSTSKAADKGSDWYTKPFWNIDKTYRAKHTIDNIIPENEACSSTTKFTVGNKSIFREISSNEDEKIIAFDYIKDAGGTLPETDEPYKLCVENTKVYKYARTGGVDTGILVIPYKIRSGDLYSDSTLGPYVALKGARFSLLGTFGLTQVSVSDAANNDIKTESGLSYALGTVWTITNSFDIGLVVGQDHLSGAAGDNFKFQDKVWWSFGIGYKFSDK